MRVILSYATEFDHHEGHQIARALQELGHTVDVVNTAVDDARKHWPHTRIFPADASLDEVIGSTPADLFLYLEPRGLMPRGIERGSCHTACVLCDTMLSLAPRVDLSLLFDDVLLLHPHALELLPHPRERVHWTPSAIDPHLFRDRGVTRDLDVAFVGATESIWQPRQSLLQRIAARYKTNDFFAERCAFEQIPELYNRARIVIHIPIVDALNPRIFEAMGCGALLLTGRVNNRIDELFTEGLHFAAYDDEDDALTKIDYLLAHDDERARIARIGYTEVHRAHTYAHRFREILATLTRLPRGTAPARRMSAEAVEDIYQRRHKQAGQADALLRRALAAPLLSASRYRTLARAATTFLRSGGSGGSGG
jgi:hypothetical protein